MKYITSLAIALLCGVACASSVDWSIDRKSFTTSDGTSDRAKGYFVTIFLNEDYNDVMDIVTSWTAPVSDASALDTYIKSTGTTGSTGAVPGSFDSSAASGTTLTLFAIAWDGASITAASNYLVASPVQSDAYVAPDNPTNKGQFTNASFANNSWKPVAAVSVPEPSSAALALAGLALLLKRRRA